MSGPKPGSKAYTPKVIIAEMKFLGWDALRKEMIAANAVPSPRTRRRNPRDEKTGRRLSVAEGRRINPNKYSRTSPKAVRLDDPRFNFSLPRQSVFDRRVKRSPEAQALIADIRKREARNAARREARAKARAENS